MNKLKHYIILKLGGHVLTVEERAILMPFWVKKFNELVDKESDKYCARILNNGFSTFYTDDK